MTEPSKELDELKQMRNDIVNSVAINTFDSLKNERKYLNMTFEKAGAACRDLANKEVAEYEKALINSQLLSLIKRIEDEVIENIGNRPMPRIDTLGNYIRSFKSFQGGFEEARVEARQALKKIGEELRKESIG